MYCQVTMILCSLRTPCVEEGAPYDHACAIVSPTPWIQKWNNLFKLGQSKYYCWQYWNLKWRAQRLGVFKLSHIHDKSIGRRITINSVQSAQDRWQPLSRSSTFAADIFRPVLVQVLHGTWLSNSFFKSMIFYNIFPISYPLFPWVVQTDKR